MSMLTWEERQRRREIAMKRYEEVQREFARERLAKLNSNSKRSNSAKSNSRVAA